MNENIISINKNTLSYLLCIQTLYKEHDLTYRYHNSNHIKDLLFEFLLTPYKKQIKEELHNAFLTAIIFHDCVYEPLSKDNEKESIKKFYHLVPSKVYNNNYEYDEYIPGLIQSTAYGEKHDTIDKQVLHDLDYGGFASPRNRYENRMYDIYHEFHRRMDYTVYRRNKIKFLNDLLKSKIFYFDHTYKEEIAINNINYEIDYLTNNKISF